MGMPPVDTSSLSEGGDRVRDRLLFLDLLLAGLALLLAFLEILAGLTSESYKHKTTRILLPSIIIVAKMFENLLRIILVLLD